MNFHDSDSDLDSTMIAATAFNNIVRLVQLSNLNFKLQLSPFSANIALKKTLVKDRSNPPFSHVDTSADVAVLAAKNVKL